MSLLRVLRTRSHPLASLAPVRRSYAKKAPAPIVPPPPAAIEEVDPLAKSACRPNTVLTGLNYLKGQPPVLALPDDEYPPWLWDLLKPRVYPDDGPGGAGERARRRQANRQEIKDKNFMKTQ